MQRIQVLRLLAIFCILSAPSIARGYTFLQGDVTSDGNPINGASVSLSCYTSGSSYQYCYESATTDSYGDFSFTTGKSGYSTCCPLKNSASWNSCTLSSYQWSNQKIGSSSTSQTVDISCNKSLTKNLEHPAKDKTIEVTVKAGSETITQGISVNAYQNQSPWTSSYVTSSSGGVYSLPVTEGCFSISAYCDWNYWRDDYGSCPYTGNINTTVCLSASDTSKTTELKFDVKDKVIHISVFAGSKRITDNICVYASQQSYPWGYGSTCKTSSDGTFDIKTTAGTSYVYSYCKNWPCSLSGSPHTTVTVGANQSSADGELYYTVKDKIIRTKIYSGSRQITSGMSVSCYQQGGNWDSSYIQSPSSGGYYECSVGTGSYSVSAYCIDWNNCDLSGYPQGKVVFTKDDPEGTVADVKLTYLDDNATVAGFVNDGSRNLPNVWVNFNATQVSTQGAGSIKASVFKKMEITHGEAQTTQVYASAQTNGSGAFTVTLPAGTYTMCAWPPYDQQNLAQACREVVALANGLTTGNLSMTKKEAKISGCVKDDNGNAVKAYVNGWNYGSSTGRYDYFWKETDSSGCYEVYGVPGYTYNVTANPNTWGSSSHSYCSYTNEGMQVLTATTQAQTLNFSIPLCDCKMALSIVSGDEVVPVSGSVNCTRSDVSGDYYQNNYAWLASGVGSMQVEPDVDYTCDSWFWDNSYTPQNGMECSCSEGSGGCAISVDPIIQDAVTGRFVSEDGTAVKISDASYLSVYATKGKVYRSCETTREDFSCDLSEGTWHLGYWIDPSSGFASSNSTTNEVSVSGKTTYDIGLLSTSTIHVTALDLDDTGRAHVWVECCPYSASQEGANEWQYMYGCGWGETDSDGKTTVKVGASSEGVDYFCNAYIPFSMRWDESINNPQECMVTAVVGESNDCELGYGDPDGQLALTVTGDTKSGSGKAARMAKIDVPSKDVVNAEDTDSRPCMNATVDCFSPAGGSFETTADSNCEARCPCMTDDTWYVVASNLVGNDFYGSEAVPVSCSEGVGEIEMEYIVTVPEAVSQTVTDAAKQSITLELSDGFSIFFPPGSLGDSGESVTCSVDPMIPPYTPNKIPANLYGYFVQCLDSNSVAIHQLNSEATIIMPINEAQLKNLGLSDKEIEVAYFDTAQGRYANVPASINGKEGAKLAVKHLTDFALVGNGYLGGIQGEDGGAAGKEEAGDSRDGGGGKGKGSKGKGGGGGCSLRR